MPGLFGVTGSPGTGKKTVSPMVAKKLGLPLVSINELASKYGLKNPETGEVEVGGMRRKIALTVGGRAVVYGHLLPYVVAPSAVDRVVVLRCEPGALKRRLVSRGYPPSKVTENVEAELIGVVSADAYDAFGAAKTSEVDTTGSTPARTARETADAFAGGKSGPRIDWTAGYDSGAKLRSLLGSTG